MEIIKFDASLDLSFQVILEEESHFTFASHSGEELSYNVIVDRILSFN